MEESKAIEQKY